MPVPYENESQAEFVARCIPIVLNDKTANSQAQAVAICNSIFASVKQKNEGSMALGYIDDDIENVLTGGILLP